MGQLIDATEDELRAAWREFSRLLPAITTIGILQATTRGGVTDARRAVRMAARAAGVDWRPTPVREND